MEQFLWCFDLKVPKAAQEAPTLVEVGQIPLLILTTEQVVGEEADISLEVEEGVGVAAAVVKKVEKVETPET